MEQITLSRLSPETFNDFTPLPTQIKNDNLMKNIGLVILVGLGVFAFYKFTQTKKDDITK